METPAQQIEDAPLSKDSSMTELEEEGGQLEMVETASNNSASQEDQVAQKPM